MTGKGLMKVSLPLRLFLPESGEQAICKMLSNTNYLRKATEAK